MNIKKMSVILFCVYLLTLGLNAEKKCIKCPEKEEKCPAPNYWKDNSTEFTIEFINELRTKVKPTLSPEMQEFKHLIDNDPVIRMNFTQMIDQVPGYYKKKGYIKDYDEMLALMDVILETAPEFNESGLVGFPFNTLLDWCMANPGGYAAFRNKKVNKMFRKIFKKWTDFLSSEKSLYVINDSPEGWKCDAAKCAAKIDCFILPDPKDKYWGFKSWNEFFIREFKPDVRCVAEPGNDKVIVSACESTVVNIERNVKLGDWFWVKSQPYSLRDMLAAPQKPQKKYETFAERSQRYAEHFKTYVKPFEGGDVYQAFLSALKYHRWHSPVSGTIKKAYVIEGTYFSQAESVGMDPAGPDESQGYIAHVATRALIFIEADDPTIGLMCVMPIGMAEVSSCIITVNEGQHLKKGDQLGHFLHGGSSHCLIFRPGAIKEFIKLIDPYDENKGCEPITIGQDIILKEQIAIAN